MKTLALICAAALALTTLSAQAQTRIQKQFGQWTVTCNENESRKACTLGFGLINTSTKRLVFGVNIVKGKEGKGLSLVVRTPLGIDIPAGVAIKFPDEKSVPVPYKTCGPQNCVGEIEFSEDLREAMKPDAKILASYALINGKTQTHEIDLKLFSEALAYLESELN